MRNLGLFLEVFITTLLLASCAHAAISNSPFMQHREPSVHSPAKMISGSLDSDRAF